jgi:hypothetical protein
LLKSIYLFSLLEAPYSKATQKQRDNIGTSREIKQAWLTPNSDLVFRVIAIHKTLSHPKTPMKKYYDSCGKKNAWIVKIYPDESHLAQKEKDRVLKLSQAEKVQKIDKKSPERQSVNKNADYSEGAISNTKKILITNQLPSILEFFDEKPS